MSFLNMLEDTPNPIEQSLLGTEYDDPSVDLGTFGRLDTMANSSVTLLAFDVNPAVRIPGSQHLHSYTLEETNAYSQSLSMAAHQLHEAQHTNNPGGLHGHIGVQDVIGGCVANGLSLRADDNEIIVPDGWNSTTRGTFTLRCTLNSPSMEPIPLIIRGFIDDHNVRPNGRHGYSIPNDAILYINDICELRNIGGIERYVNITKQLRAPDSFGNGFNHQNGDVYTTLNPTDVIRTIAAGTMINDVYGGQVVNTTNRLVNPVGASVNCNSPVNWVTGIVSGYMDSVNDVVASGGNISDSESLNRQVLAASMGLSGETAEQRRYALLYEFLSHIATGGSTSYFSVQFTYGTLLNLDPSLDDRTSVTVVDTRDRAGLPVIRDEYGKTVNPYDLQGHESTSGGTIETTIGTGVSLTIASILQRASVSSLTGAMITNRTMDGSLEVVLGAIGLPTHSRQVVESTSRSIIRAIVREVSPIIHNLGDVTLSDISYYPPNIMSMNIRIGSSLVTPYALPLWADNMLAPTIQDTVSPTNSMSQYAANEASPYENTIDTLVSTLDTLVPM